MKYAINLDNSNRVLRATFSKFADASSILVDSLPEGNLNEYIYENGEFIHSPQAPSDEEVAAQKLSEAKQGLAETDYIAAKSMDKLASCTTVDEMLQVFSDINSEYSETINQRQIWRDTINEIEGNQPITNSI